MRNPEAVAWTIATEGCIGIYKRTDIKTLLRPMISVSNTSLKLVEDFKDLTGIGYVTNGTNFKGHPRWNSIYRWEICSYRDCLLFIADIIGYLPIKQEQAKIMLEFCSRGILRNGSPFEPRDFELCEKIQKLNSGGKKIA